MAPPTESPLRAGAALRLWWMERKEERPLENSLSCLKAVAESLATLGRSDFYLDLGFHLPAHKRQALF